MSDTISSILNRIYARLRGAGAADVPVATLSRALIDNNNQAVLEIGPDNSLVASRKGTAILDPCGNFLAGASTAPTLTENPASGQLILSHPAGDAAAIYYTLDGNVPTAASTRYTAPFTLPSGTVTVNAVAFAAPASPVATGTYIVVGPDALTTAWLSAVAAAGGNVTPAQTSAVDAAAKSLRAANLLANVGAHAGLVLFNPRTGDFAASKVPLIGTADETYTNFTVANYSPTTGLQGGAPADYSTGRRLDTGLNLLNAGLSASGASLFARIRNTPDRRGQGAFLHDERRAASAAPIRRTQPHQAAGERGA